MNKRQKAKHENLKLDKEYREALKKAQKEERYSLRYNNEGYSDPTAYRAISNAYERGY